MAACQAPGSGLPPYNTEPSSYHRETRESSLFRAFKPFTFSHSGEKLRLKRLLSCWPLEPAKSVCLRWWLRLRRSYNWLRVMADPLVVIFDSNADGAGTTGNELRLSPKDGLRKTEPSGPRGRPKKNPTRKPSQGSLARNSKNTSTSCYEFVNSLGDPGEPNPSALKRVRSHVMHHHKRKSEHLNSVQVSNNPFYDNISHKQLLKDLCLALNMVPSGLARFDPFDSLPPHMQKQPLHLLSIGKRALCAPCASILAGNPCSYHFCG
ncbi:hypothetical protein F5Y16DRAFT_4138 [Xylariaceae sp. FL0255]|nr:hypothetical protein F5Y16DRAFT_4138 [Xylariaceae sp. FL0255]